MHGSLSVRPPRTRRLRALAGRPLFRQFSRFFGVGLMAAATHFGVLIALVEMHLAGPVPAALVGYTTGGVVSYALNRRHTYASDRPHREASWRFAVVSAVGFGLTWLLMSLLVAVLPYLVAQLVTTGLVMFWSFTAHKFWTFREPAIPLA